MKKLKYIVFVFLFFAKYGIAQSDELLSLAQVLIKTETTFPEVLKYDGLTKAWAEKANASTAWMPPQISIGINRFPYSFMGMTDKGPMNQAGIMFTAEQMITNPVKLNAKRDYFSSRSEIEVQKAEWTKNEFRTIAKKLYYQRQIAEKKILLIRENEELLKLLISTAESRYAYNQAELGTVYKARARLEELGNMVLMEESRVAESNIGLNTLLSRDLNTVFSIDTSLFIPAYSLELDTISRSDIRVMNSEIESMKKEQVFMATGSKPDFGLQFQHMQMFGMPAQFSIMGMMSIPIVPWSSKMYKSDVSAMQFEIQAMQQEVKSMQLMAARMQAEKYSMLQFSTERLNKFGSSILISFEKNLEVNLLSFRQNSGNFFVLLDAWDMLLMKKIELYDLWFTTLNLSADFEQEIEK